MASKFPLITLDMIAEVIDSRHKTPNYTESGYPMVRVVDIKGGELDLKDTKRVTKDIYEDFSKGRSPLAGDLIISRVGSYGNISYVSENDEFCLGQNTAFIIPNEKNHYLYYALISPFVQQQIEDMAVGAVQKTISLKSIKNLNIPFPDLDIRNFISKTLRNIDTRISINNKINIQLEQMSQILFKSWFVDFDPVIDNALDAGNSIPEALQSRVELRQKVRNSTDFKLLPADIRVLFPAEFEETELGWVPKGWKISTAGDELVVKGGSTPSTSNADFWENGTIHWTSPKDLTGNDSKVLLDTSKKITELGLKKISSGLLPTDTVLMSSRAPIGYLALAKMPMAINQGYIAIPSSKNLSPEYIIYWLENIMDDIKGMAGGTTFAEISKGAFKTISLVIPSKNIVDEFTRLAHQHFGKVVSNTEQINALTALRDTLLPKLISGELSLEDLPDLINQTEAA